MTIDAVAHKTRHPVVLAPRNLRHSLLRAVAYALAIVDSIFIHELTHAVQLKLMGMRLTTAGFTPWQCGHWQAMACVNYIGPASAWQATLEPVAYTVQIIFLVASFFFVLFAR